MTLLLVFAMEQERAGAFAGYEVLHTQIGKVNASYALTRRLFDGGGRPDLVVNLGTVGSRKHKGGTLINPTCFVQRDMDVSALGFERGQTPFSDDPVRVEYGQRLEGIEGGVCGTGDNFDVSGLAGAYDVVDMEAYALALICQREDVPFLCLKYVSDGADGAAEQDFNAALLRAAAALEAALKGAGY